VRVLPPVNWLRVPALSSFLSLPSPPHPLVGSLGKPIMMVPQAFGGGENWARAPSAAEERLMTYLGWLNGACAIQYFVRSAPVVFPYAAGAWSEIRQMAAESVALTSALAGGKKVATMVQQPPASRLAPTLSPAVQAGAWEDRDGSVTVIVANSNTGPSTGSQPFSVLVNSSVWQAEGVSVVSVFENLAVSSFSAETRTISDHLRPLETRTYKISSSKTSASSSFDKSSLSAENAVTKTALASPNLVYNPSYEECVNPAVPDGNYLGAASLDDAASFFADSRLSVDGRNSLRLVAPSDGQGVTVSPYTLPKLVEGARYSFSVWVRGAKGGESVAFDFNPSILTIAAPAAASTGNSTLSVKATATWAQVAVVLTAGPASACPYGCRGWMHYALSTAGTVWLDVLSLQQL
jgi:hypothetical protein